MNNQNFLTVIKLFKTKNPTIVGLKKFIKNYLITFTSAACKPFGPCFTENSTLSFSAKVR